MGFLHGNHTIDGEAAVQTGLDIVSIFDPTGVTSLLSAGISAKNGDLLGATMGVLGAIPIAGEFAKAEKVANDVKVVDKLIADGEKVATKVENAYSRPNNATTKEQRASVQDKPCVTCGKTESKMVADHKTPLVKEHYETGKIDKSKMRDKNSVQPQCPKCSAKQGAEMSKYSKEQKKINGL